MTVRTMRENLVRDLRDRLINNCEGGGGGGGGVDICSVLTILD